ncbi:3-hydroxyacyl-CoA dehydrogenase NAD-binding domain-containing protein [Noviherbaspirillum sedimenti]|uniref:3-hydroxyacyl-CoA dehydrogenase n=1 Tax=Noviherbaspirillum sedimenti TaxID=2320865 RepID=A0A3A3G2A2_9BURK|nr:3-hydroxyacyl-CoA dehydrogenase NAD-binding domain-containing protein [Noviherbaspirillum sedimenti]RJG02597.1 3-hydroxyacyl-CoA dehydrogenase [Noviherbaspirillum sedimenti]
MVAVLNPLSEALARSRVRLERHGEIAAIIIDNPPVNAGSREVRCGLLDAIYMVAAEDAIKAAVLIGAGSTFVAGSDIREFGKPLEEPQLPLVLAAIEACPKPVVAAIHGAALGGGFELALACDARVMLPDAVVGLPEVTLGMIPGAGGTQRTPRLVGVAAAIEIICSGRRIKAAEAVSLGLVDAVIEGDLRTGALAYARALGAASRKRRLSEAALPPEEPERIDQAEREALRAGRGRPQVVKAIEAIKSAAVLPFAEALAREREAFQQLRMSDEAAALRHLFFAEREAAKVAGLEGAVAADITRVGIVGAGTMGTGIAICFADAGYMVTLIEQDAQALQRGMQRLQETYERSVKTGRLDAGLARTCLERIAGSIEFASLADADLVVEAVFEDLAVKTEVFQRLDAILRPGAILASNTSYLDLDRLAAATGRAADVVGLHFFSPAQVMRLLEVVRGAATSAHTLATALAVAKKIRKLAVVARVGEGFIGNRIYAAYRRQCEFMLEEGAYPEQVDAALEQFGFAMGPFAVGDMSGLDIAWRTRLRLAASRDPRERYVEIADRLCEQGRFGQKTGAGWYRYPPGARRGETDPEVRALVEAASQAKGIPRRAFDAAEIQRRALVTMINEAALILQEGIAERAADIDLVLVNGYGFPRHEGGPLFWAGRRSRNELLAELDHIAEVSGPGFRKADIASLLEQQR